MKNLILITFLFICINSFVFAQSKTVSQFQERHSSGYALFFYPSTLRMINIEKNPDYYQLVSDVDKLQFLSFDKKENSISAEAIKQLRQEIQKENYQALFSMDDKANSIHIYALGDDDKPEGVVGIIDNTQSLILVDMKGFINAASLLRLMQSDFNFDRIAQLMNTKIVQEQENEEKPNNSN